MGALDNLKGMLGSPGKAMLLIHRDQVKGDPAAALGGMVQALGSGNAVPKLPRPMEKLIVQYNPSSLQISVNANAIQIKSMQQGLDPSALIQNEREPSVVLTVQLIFDDMNAKDAFSADAEFLRVSAGDLASGVMALAKKHTVQPQIEGLVATMLNNETRCISFNWGDMSFTGSVSSVSSSYTMFNRKGEPVRGDIRLMLTQTISDKAVSGYWVDAQKKFKKLKSGKSELEKMGSFINLNL